MYVVRIIFTSALQTYIVGKKRMQRIYIFQGRNLFWLIIWLWLNNQIIYPIPKLVDTTLTNPRKYYKKSKRVEQNLKNLFCFQVPDLHQPVEGRGSDHVECDRVEADQGHLVAVRCNGHRRLIYLVFKIG